VTVAGPVILFGESILLGAALGLLYDVFRILRISFKNGKVLIFLEDVLFFTVATIVSFLFIVLQNDGVLRAFLILGELLGAVLYFFTVSLVILKAATGIVHGIRTLLFWIYRIFFSPFVRLFCWIFKKCGKIGTFFKKLFQTQKKHLKACRQVVYNVIIKNRGSERKWRKKRARNP